MPGPAPKLRGQVPPAAPGMEDKQDPLQRSPVINPRPPTGTPCGWGSGMNGAISSHRWSSTIHWCFRVAIQAWSATRTKTGNDRPSYEIKCK
ncbi:hypothetical protein GCM10011374_41060 [Kocuria dechangensis]|uniref:Uncharacterized protein n=1 Tax=Kocuria dechangensis TaxID=1176249 RepID=A0A917H9M5_9MICC|nr:hypothetical protein GCM10011374_41060 [Kocuria dechangensis]